MVSNTTDWSHRIPFALQWIFPLPILIAVFFAPESPWWLIRQNRFADAKNSLHRLRSKPKSVSDAEFDLVLVGTMESMIDTNDREQRIQSGTSYKDCLKGVDRRRTEITCMVWIIQTLCGSTFMGFSTYFCKSFHTLELHAKALITILTPSTNRRASRHPLIPCLHPFSRTIRPRPHWRNHLLGTNVAFRSKDPLPLWPNSHMSLRLPHRYPCLCPSAPSKPWYLNPAQLVHCCPPSRLHTRLRCHPRPYMLCSRLRDSQHQAP